LQFGQFLDLARADAVEHIGMAARSAGGGTGRIDQNRVVMVLRLPFQRIGADRPGGKTGAFEVGLEEIEPLLRNIERGHFPPLRRELQRLAPRRSTQVERSAALPCPEQARGQGCRQILHPPCTVLETG
jgi:hypothetical protein